MLNSIWNNFFMLNISQALTNDASYKQTVSYFEHTQFCFNQFSSWKNIIIAKTLWTSVLWIESEIDLWIYVFRTQLINIHHFFQSYHLSLASFTATSSVTPPSDNSCLHPKKKLSYLSPFSYQWPLVLWHFWLLLFCYYI